MVAVGSAAVEVPGGLEGAGSITCDRSKGCLYFVGTFPALGGQVPGTVSLTAIGERAALRALRLAPKQLYSTIVDWGARRRVPRRLRQPLYVTYSRLVGANLREVELPLESYNSFGDFFARKLRAGAREASTDMTAVAAPCDGRIGAVGQVHNGALLQAKEREYLLAELLASVELAAQLEDCTQVTIYLSPADYHRVHAPLSGTLVSYTYIPGARNPVGQFFAKRIDNLFSDNERLVLELDTDTGPMAIVLVGALGVGNLRLNLSLDDPPLLSRELEKQPKPLCVRLEAPLSVARGQELGAFHLGSTVVMVFGPQVFDAKQLGVGERVECGQGIGRLMAKHGWALQ